jgi:hypothetical protein
MYESLNINGGESRRWLVIILSPPPHMHLVSSRKSRSLVLLAEFVLVDDFSGGSVGIFARRLLLGVRKGLETKAPLDWFRKELDL